MEILHTLFGKKKSGTGNSTRMGKLYNEEQLLRAQGRAMDAEEDRVASYCFRPQPVEFVLDTKHPPSLREFVKIMEEKAALPPVSAQPRTMVLLLDTRPSVAAEQVVKFVERRGISPSAPVQPLPVELVLDPTHPLALREVMKFAAVEPTDTFSPAPQRRIRLVLDTKQELPDGRPEE